MNSYKLLLLLLFFTNLLSAQKDLKNLDYDSIIKYRNLSKNKDFDVNKRLDFALKSSKLAKEFGVDSLLLLSNRQLALMYFNTEQYKKYIDLNHKNIYLAGKVKDTAALAIATTNLGSFYQFENKNDSAYYYYSKSLKYSKSVNNKGNMAFVYMNIASVQETERDFAGSDENAIEAVKIYNMLPRNEDNLYNLWFTYNTLATVSSRMKQYEKSISYYNQAIDIAKEMSDGFMYDVWTTNNLALVYQEKGNYLKAIELYESLVPLKEKYDKDDPTFYALVISNISHTKSLAGNFNSEDIEKTFKTAYHISDSLEDNITKLPVSIDLSKFYLKQKQADSSLKYVNIAYKIAKETSSNDILLDALMVLSELNEGESGKAYLKEHIKLSDSLLNVERNVGNKFARIEFETDKVEEENEKITQQRMWLLVISAGLLMTLFLLYIIITQRAKNKELKFEKDQQKANEDIYNLMLSQQDKVDEARANEKVRISKELHDGILGRLFGTRLSLDSFNFSEGKDAIDKRATYISELKVIEDDIRKISHDLNTDFVSGSGFMDIVSELIEKQTNAYELEFSFNFTDDIHWETLPNKTKINIYRIIQESLQNIYKHANAKTVKISFELKNNVICLSIIDDGDGFDINKSKKGIGIKNINSRVEEAEGKAQFHSVVNKGTEVIITIPYKN